MRSYEKGLWLLILLLTAAVFYAVFFLVPSAMGLGSLVRIAFFHIPVAWGAVLAFLVSAWYAVRYLRRPSARLDAVSAESARLGLIFVVLATLSGAVFSKLTWGSYWNWDPRQTTIFVLLLIYAAYLTLRSVIPDAHRRVGRGHLRAVLVPDRAVPRLHHPAVLLLAASGACHQRQRLHRHGPRHAQDAPGVVAGYDTDLHRLALSSREL